MPKSNHNGDISLIVQLDQMEKTAGDIVTGRVLLKGPTKQFADTVPQVKVTISGWELARTTAGPHSTLVDRENIFLRQVILSDAKLLTTSEWSSRFSGTTSSKRVLSSRSSSFSASSSSLFAQSSRSETATPSLCYEFPFQIALDDEDLPSSMRCGGYYRRGRLHGHMFYYPHPIAGAILSVAGLFYDNISETGFRPDVSHIDGGAGCEVQYAVIASYFGPSHRKNAVTTDVGNDDKRVLIDGGDLIYIAYGEVKSPKKILMVQARRPPQAPPALSAVSFREAVPVSSGLLCGLKQEVCVKTSLDQRTYMTCDEITVHFDSVINKSYTDIDYFLVELNCRFTWTVRWPTSILQPGQARTNRERLPLLREKVTIGDDGQWPRSVVLKIPTHASNTFSGKLIECKHSVDVKLGMKGGLIAQLVSSTPINIYHCGTTS